MSLAGQGTPAQPSQWWQSSTYNYDITGEAVPKDTHDPSAPKPFELKVKCP
jgi:hypothetical protein